MSKKSKLIIGISAAALGVVTIIMIAIFSNKKNNTIVYTVNFDSGNGQVIEQAVKQGEVIDEPKVPTKEGYIFIGWKYEGEIFDFSKDVNKDVTLVAEWQKIEAGVKTFVIRFNTDGGTTLANQVIEEGNKIDIPNTPEKEGYIFKGWILDGEEYNFELDVNKDLELTAKWEKKSNTVNNSNNNSNQNKEENIKVTTPTLTNAFGGGGTANLNIVSEGAYATEGSTSVIKGWELYVKNGSEYTLVKSQEGFNNIQVTVDVGESKTYVAKAYALNKSGKKVYSGYSNEIKIDNSKVTTPTLTNAFGGGGTANLNIVSEGAYATEGSTSVIKGWELYVKNGSEYTLVKSQEGFNNIQVTVDVGESKTYVAKAYALNKSGKKVYSGYSNEIKIDNSKVTTPTLTNAFGDGGTANLNIVSEGAYATEGSANGITGWELYEKVGTSYNLVKSQEEFNNIQVTVDVGESKTYVAKAYALNKSGKKVYSGYSNEIKIDNSKVTTPTLTNAFGDGGTANLNIVSEGAYATEGSTNGIKGWELYVKNGSEYTLVKSQEGFNNIQVTVDVGESKTYVAKVYALNKSGKKVYSGYSNEIVIE